MDFLEAGAIGAAAIAAGTMNAVVGAGTLITFPTLLAFGFPPVLANVSNNVGLVPGSLSAVYGYRRELRGQSRKLLRFGAASLLGGLLGALLLVTLPPGTFQAAVPVLILAGCALVLLQPRLQVWLRRRESPAADHGGVPLWLGVFGTGGYGGYFGAAQGVILMGLLGTFLNDHPQRLNAAKNVLASIVNGVAAIVFITVSHVDWTAALVIAAGSSLGGQLGARVGRRLPPAALRAAIVVIGVTAATVFMITKL